MYVSYLDCPKCGAHYDSEKIIQLCRCGAPLLVRYEMEKVKKHFRKEVLASRKAGLWRYREILPIQNEKNIVTLGEGMTPLLLLKNLGHELGMSHLYLKDEGLIPTGTFKARGAAVGVSKAKELGIRVLAMPTNGNAGGAWGAYCAQAGIKAIIVMPKDAPAIREGIFACPEGAATLSAVIRLVKNGWIQQDEKVVLLNTGTGLKYPETVKTDPPMLEPEDRLPRI